MGISLAKRLWFGRMGRFLARKIFREAGEMKKLAKIIFICFFAYFPVLSFALADVVWDMATETLAVPKLVEETVTLGQQLERLKTEIQAGNFTDWQNASNEVTNKLGTLAQNFSAMSKLAYSASNADSQFQQTFPGYTAPANYQQSYTNIVNNTTQALEAALGAIGMSAKDFQNENARLSKLQNVTQSASGTTSAVQAAAQIATEEVNQLQLLRQTTIAQTNAQTAYYAAQTQKEANANMAIDNMLKDSSHDITNHTLNGDPINNPFDK